MKKNLFKLASLVSLVAFTPIIAFAASCFDTYRSIAGGSKLGDLFNYVTCTINSSVIPLIFGIALVSFIWGVVQYVINNDEEAKKAQGRQFMIWGIVALTVMIGVWGLVGVLGGTFGIKTNLLPQVRPPGSSSSTTAPSSAPGGPCGDGTYNCP
jgi:hypothetical protein